MIRRLILSSLVLLLLLGAAPNALAQARYIPLQGQLTQQNVSGGAGNAVVEDGVYTIQVNVYQVPTGGAPHVWQDTFQNLPVIGGVFNIILGSQKSLDQITPAQAGKDLLDVLAEQGQLYVGLTITHVDGTAVPGDPVEMLPRLTLLPVAVASLARNAQRFHGHEFQQLFDDATDAALRAQDSELLKGHSWSVLLQGDEGGEAPVGANPADAGYQIASHLLPAAVNPGSLLRPGTILDQYGGMIDQVIDPRTLDTGWDSATNAGGDGIPDKPYNEARTIHGAPVDTTYSTWMACVQNASRSLRFPDPATPGLSPEAAADYQKIEPFLRGVLVPNRNFVLGQAGEPTYTWRQILPNSGQTLDPSALVPDAIAYDAQLDAYWTLGQHSNTYFTLIWRDPSDAYRYNRRYLSLDGILPHNHADDVTGMQVIAPGNGSRYLVVGMRTGVHNLYRLEITGTTVADAGLSNFLTWNSSSPEGQPSIVYPQRGWYAYAFDPVTAGMHFVGGQRAGGYTHEHDVYTLNSFGQPIVEYADHTAPYAGIGNLFGAISPVGRRLYVYGGSITISSEGDDFVKCFDLDSRQWQTINMTSAIKPGPRIAAAAWVNPVTDRFVIWGGSYDTNHDPADRSLYEFNHQTGEWIQVPAESTWPSARLHHGYTWDTLRNRAIMYGGRTGYHSSPTNNLNELWELEFGGAGATEGAIIRVGD